MDVRLLSESDRDELHAFLRRDVWNHVYLLGLLASYGVQGPRVRFWGAFSDGALVGAVAEAREVHCWYAAPSVAPLEVAVRLGRELVPPVAAVVLGPEDVVRPVLAEALPPGRVRGAAQAILGVSHDGANAVPPVHPVRRATFADLPALVDLYEGYEHDGYPTRDHVRQALSERLARSGVYLVEREGRLVAARRIELLSPEVALFGGLTTDPAFRGQGFSQSIRRASAADLRERGIVHCSLRHDGNTTNTRPEHRPHGRWLIANLAVPPPPRWQTLLARVRGRLLVRYRPCRRRQIRA